jgi:nucleoside-diphosphate-sugar epimerase
VRAVDAAFVTGGSGFIGGCLIERLVAEGHGVRALARSQAAAERVAALGAEPVRGELADVEAMRAGAEGCEWAFHAAAMLGDWGRPQDFQRGNVDGTANALQACAQAGVRRFVHVGTEAALMAGEPLVEADESAPLRPDSPGLYSATKARAEQLVHAAAREGFETVVLRPRFVWGVGDTTLLPQIAGLVRNGRFAWVDGGRHRTSTTHVANVVEGLLLAARRGRAGEAYFVTDGEPVVFRDFLGELIATQGLTPPTRSMPAGLARALATAGEGLWRALRLPGRPPLTRFAYWVLAQECTIKTDKARGELGYAPVKTIAEGLRELREEAPV